MCVHALQKSRGSKWKATHASTFDTCCVMVAVFFVLVPYGSRSLCPPFAFPSGSGDWSRSSMTWLSMTSQHLQMIVEIHSDGPVDDGNVSSLDGKAPNGLLPTQTIQQPSWSFVLSYVLSSFFRTFYFIRLSFLASRPSRPFSAMACSWATATMWAKVLTSPAAECVFFRHVMPCRPPPAMRFVGARASAN